jgi:hypothetical protein
MTLMIIIQFIHNNNNNNNEDISFIFYDLEKVYDSAPRKALWQALKKVNVNQ